MLSRFSRVWLFATLWTVALKSPLSMLFSMRILKWAGLPFLGGSSWPRDWTYVSLDSCTDRQVITSIILEAQCRKSWYNQIFSQFSSVAQSCLTLCNPMNHSTPGLPVHHQLPEFIQTHAHWVGDSIKPSHPLLSPSPPALNPSQHQSLFQWVNSSHEVAKV